MTFNGVGVAKVAVNRSDEPPQPIDVETVTPLTADQRLRIDLLPVFRRWMVPTSKPTTTLLLQIGAFGIKTYAHISECAAARIAAIEPLTNIFIETPIGVPPGTSELAANVMPHSWRKRQPGW